MAGLDWGLEMGVERGEAERLEPMKKYMSGLVSRTDSTSNPRSKIAQIIPQKFPKPHGTLVPFGKGGFDYVPVTSVTFTVTAKQTKSSIIFDAMRIFHFHLSLELKHSTA
jgi:hypothetical protein